MVKQVVAVRRDLKMGKGKTCAQVAHASLESAEAAREEHGELYREWKEEGGKKVVVVVESEEELGSLFEKARSLRLPCYLVRDSGLTQLEPGTVTALGMGPAQEEKLDRLTSHLKLL